MLPRALSWFSFIACTLVIASFLMFAHDQLAGAALHQEGMLAGRVPTAPAAAVHHGQPRQFIDQAASRLATPFKSIVSSRNPWVEHLIPLLAALLVYGVVLGTLKRFAQGGG